MNTIQNFQLFCLESFRCEKGITGESAFETFEKCGVFSFIEESYDMLHTQSKEYIVTEIDYFISKHERTISR